MVSENAPILTLVESIGRFKRAYIEGTVFVNDTILRPDEHLRQVVLGIPSAKIVLAFIGFLFLWFGLFLLTGRYFLPLKSMNLDISDVMEWRSRCVSSCHSVFTTIGAALIIWFYEDVFIANPIFSTPMLDSVLLSSTCSFYLFDIFINLYLTHKVFRRRPPKSIIIHHITVIVALSMSLCTSAYYYIMTVALLMEASTSVVNYEWFLYVRSGRSSATTSYVMLISVFLVRVFFPMWFVFEPNLSFNSSISSLLPPGWVLIIWLLFFVVFILNLIWCNRIVNKVIRGLPVARLAHYSRRRMHISGRDGFSSLPDLTSLSPRSRTRQNLPLFHEDV